MQKNFLFIGIFVAVLGYVYGASDPNTPKVLGVSVAKDVRPTTPNVQTQQNIAFEQMLIQKELSSFEKKTDVLRWAVTCVLTCIGFIITVVLAAAGYISWKSQKEYRESLNDIKEALKDAKEFSRKAEESCGKSELWEKKSRQSFESIDEQTKLKINEFDRKTDEKFIEIDSKIEELGDKVTKRVIRESKKQHELSDRRNRAVRATIDGEHELADKLWKDITTQDPQDYIAFNNWGSTLRGWARLGGPKAENRYRQACEKYQKAIEIKPDFQEGFSNWGIALSDWAKLGGPEAENRYRQACEKYQKAIEIKSDFHEAFNNWGIALSDWAKLSGPEAENRYRQACEKYQKAIEIKPDYHTAFNNWGVALSGWAKLGGPEAENRYRQACEKYQKAIEIKPDFHDAFSNWGNAFSGWAKLGGPEVESRYRQACEKYQKAIEIKPDYHTAFINWGNTLLGWSRLKDEKEKLYQEAEQVLLKAEGIKRGGGAYNLACVFALRGNEEKCKQWLKVGEEAGTLETREYAMKDEDLNSVKEKDWFKQIRWKNEQDVK